ncbi:hypothetical protein DXG01_001491 [Tephrocybe rancida]|nr:hypothetical protein DXG01_001491 [Tephrocybe rancida]
MADNFRPPPGAPMEPDDDDVIMGVCLTPTAPVPISVTDISMSDPPAPPVPSPLSCLGPAAAPSPIASASMKQTRNSGPRSSLPFAFVASAPTEARATPLALFCPGGFQQHLQHPTGPGKAISKAWTTPNSPVRFVTPQVERASTVPMFQDCHLPLPDLSTPSNTVLVEASAPSILYNQPPLLASTSSLSWSGNTLLASSWTPRPNERAPPLDAEIQRGRKEVEDKTLKEKEARKAERLNHAYASICKRKRDIDEEEEVRIRREIVTRPTKKLRTAVVEVMETAKGVVAEVAVVVLDAVAVIGSVSRAILGCRHEVQKSSNQDEVRVIPFGLRSWFD